MLRWLYTVQKLGETWLQRVFNLHVELTDKTALKCRECKELGSLANSRIFERDESSKGRSNSFWHFWHACPDRVGLFQVNFVTLLWSGKPCGCLVIALVQKKKIVCKKLLTAIYPGIGDAFSPTTCIDNAIYFSNSSWIQGWVIGQTRNSMVTGRTRLPVGKHNVESVASVVISKGNPNLWKN